MVKMLLGNPYHILEYLTLSWLHFQFQLLAYYAPWEAAVMVQVVESVTYMADLNSVSGSQLLSISSATSI